MTGKTLMDDLSLLVLKNAPDIERPLTASQLSAIVTAAESLILNAAHVADCNHEGSRYRKEYEDFERCGVCGRSANDEIKESLADA